MNSILGSFWHLLLVSGSFYCAYWVYLRSEKAAHLVIALLFVLIGLWLSVRNARLLKRTYDLNREKPRFSAENAYQSDRSLRELGFGVWFLFASAKLGRTGENAAGAAEGFLSGSDGGDGGGID